MYSHAEQGFVSRLGGAFLSRLWLSLHLSSIYSHASGLEQIWSILLFLCPRGPGLFSALSTVPSPPFPLPGFPELSLGTCAGPRVWNSPIPPCLCPQSRLPHITPWSVGFFKIKNKFGFWFTNHEFFPHRAHQRPVKLLAFPSVYKAILYYKELIFLSHAWLFWVFFKTCTLNISNLIFSYELNAVCAQLIFGEGSDRAHPIKNNSQRCMKQEHVLGLGQWECSREECTGKAFAEPWSCCRGLWFVLGAAGLGAGTWRNGRDPG